MKKILVVDDDSVTRDLLREVLEAEGFLVQSASSGEEALRVLGKDTFLVLSDIRMLGMDGLDLLERVRKISDQIFVILMTGFGNMDGAVRAIQAGAFDYISKPFRIQELKSLVLRAYKQWSSLESQEKINLLESTVRKRTLIGRSPSILEVYKSLAKAALSSSSVLITGESGTGKELVAKAIHENSARRDKRFLAINCGSLTDSLLESELFGHVKGSFTGATQDKRGLLEEADGGTLFLDEVGDVSPSLQVKLLRVLQEGEYKPVGSNEIRKVDLRLIAATHRKLELMIQDGRFRDDLYYRLKVIEIALPPLRERMTDLPILVNHFVAHYSEANHKRISHLSPEAMEFLSNYSWPGNVRELENAIERAVAMSTSSVLFLEDFAGLNHGTDTVAAKPTASLEQMERDHILKVLEQTQYNKSKASFVLGIDRATLYRKAQRYGIELKGVDIPSSR